jgi:hypothetical protein
MAMKRIADPDWFDHLRVGDVLRDPWGNFRVVRKVSRWTRRPRSQGGTLHGVGPLRGVTLTIRRRSWTNRCYTVYSANDLKVGRWSYVGARIKLTRDIDGCIEQAIHQPAGRPFILYAKHVRGVA